MRASAGLPAGAVSRESLQGGRWGARSMTLTGTTAFLMVLAACAGNNTTANGDQPAGGAAHKVWYRAEGVGAESASYTLRSDDGGTVQGDIDLPLTNKQGETGLTFTGFKSGDSVYLSVQNAADSGSVTCRIFVDGTEISNNTSDGAYKIATCQGKVP